MMGLTSAMKRNLTPSVSRKGAKTMIPIGTSWLYPQELLISLQV